MVRAIGIGLGMAFNGGSLIPGEYFPRVRNEYGLILHPSPNLMVTTPTQQATLPTPDTFSIPAGSGNAYRALVSSGVTFGEVGSKVLFYITVDEGSGTFSTPTVRLIAAAPFGTQTLNLVEETPGTWVYEATVPTGGFTSVLLTLASTDASNPITGTAFAWSVSPVGATSAAAEPEVATLNAWIAADYAEGQGNLWAIEKQTLAAASGTALVTLRSNGLTVYNTDVLLVMVRIETAGGNPAIVDRVYMKGVSEVPNDSQNVFLHPVKGQPGLYAQRVRYDALTGPTTYLELNVDNAQSGAFYTQEAVTVTAIQVYRSMPATIASPALLSYAASEGLIVNSYDGVLDVYTPGFAADGREYFQWKSERYDTTGNAAGGGLGSILEDLYYTRRTGTWEFCPVYKLTDIGQHEFSFKKNDGTDEHTGHDVHGGQERRASPVFEIDTGSGWVTQTVDARADINCQKARWTEYSQVYDRLDGTTVLANLDTVKTWEGRTLKMSFTKELLVEVSYLVCFMGMFSPYANIDNVAGNGSLFQTLTMPNQGGATYTRGGGVNATYPNEKRFVMTSTFGIGFDIEVKEPVNSNYRSWIQSGGGSGKFYPSVVGQRDSFGIAIERVPLVLPAGTILTQEVWITATKQ